MHELKLYLRYRFFRLIHFKVWALSLIHILMIQTQPATMMTMKGKQLAAEERDILRASMVSEGLK